MGFAPVSSKELLDIKTTIEWSEYQGVSGANYYETKNCTPIFHVPGQVS